MNTQSMSSSTVKVNLSGGILKNAQAESARIGISLQDFIRMLMATYFANATSIRAVSHDQMLLNRAKEEIKRRDFTKVTSEEELNRYFNSLET